MRAVILRGSHFGRTFEQESEWGWMRVNKERTNILLFPLRPTMDKCGQSVDWRQKEEEGNTRHKEEETEERKVGWLQVG